MPLRGSPLKYYKDLEGRSGIVYDVLIHEENIYLGMNQSDQKMRKHFELLIQNTCSDLCVYRKVIKGNLTRIYRNSDVYFFCKS